MGLNIACLRPQKASFEESSASGIHMSNSKEQVLERGASICLLDLCRQALLGWREDLEVVGALLA